MRANERHYKAVTKLSKKSNPCKCLCITCMCGDPYLEYPAVFGLDPRHLARKALRVQPLGRGTAWLDTGTHDSLLDASCYVEVVQKRQGLKVACPEEIAWEESYIDDAQLERLGAALKKNEYGQYLLRRLKEGRG